MNGACWMSLPIQIDWERVGDASLSTDDGSVHVPFSQNIGSFDLPIGRKVGGGDPFEHEF